MKRFLLILFVIGLIGAAVYHNQQRTVPAGAAENKQPKPVQGYPAPPFSLKGLDGRTYTFDGPREKPLIVNFWASWCGPCRLEAPDLRRIYEKFHDNIDLFAVNLTHDDDLRSAQEFVNTYQLPFPIPLDEKGKVGDAYLVQAIPTTFFIDRRGVIQRIVTGVADPPLFERFVQELIAQ